MKRKIVEKKLTDVMILREFVLRFADNEEIRKIPKAVNHTLIPEIQKGVDFRVTPDFLKKSLIEFADKIIQPCVDIMIKAIGNQGDLLVFSELKLPDGTMNGATIEFEDIYARILSQESMDSETGQPFFYKRIDMTYTWYNRVKP